MKCPKSLRKVYWIGEVVAIIENFVSAFITDKGVIIIRDY
jgi:hypothetical protein